MSPRGRARARRGEGDKLREEILLAAEALMVETADAEAVSIRAIAERVGVTAPAIYRHFADKDALIQAVCDLTFDKLDAWVDRWVDGLDDPVERLAASGRAYIEFALAHPGHYRAVMMNHSPAMSHDLADWERVGAASFEALVANVQAAIDAGALAGPSAFDVACTLWAHVHGIASLRLVMPGFPWPSLDAQMDLFVQALCTGLGGSNVPAVNRGHGEGPRSERSGAPRPR